MTTLTALGATLLGFSVFLGTFEPASFRAPLPEPAVLQKGPASRNANLSPAACKSKLLAQKAPVQFVRSAVGVATPTRIVGPLGGVEYQTAPKTVSYGIADCRLVLTLLEAAPILRAHHVKSMRIDNFYRKGARLPSHRKKSQHAYALAADVTSLTLDDGTKLNIEEDFHGQMGAPVCGPQAKLYRRDPKSLALRTLTCDLARAGLFHHILTPHHDRAHRNHLHLDIARDNKWFSVD
jgi:Extensin-like protein C-terminus